ncbi:MAG TPA: diphthine--ammonia ligase [Chitinophagaceae bacterium]|nr:diphthine--ammonia ligase [Chitinophagaceae bacterium]
MKAYINWSGGKDSALALYHILKDKAYSVEKLLTNVSSTCQRISMHGVRKELLEQQAAAIGISLQALVLQDQPSMEEYEKHMMTTLQQLHQEGFTHSVFGDIFLEDLKIYRETQLARVGRTAVFPLWKRNTKELMNEFIDLGFKAITVCVNEKYLDKSFCGRMIDKDFIRDLPDKVDVCGENGEYHTFVYDGPIFKMPVPFKKGEIVSKKYAAPRQENDNCFLQESVKDYKFYFCDLLQQ